MLFCVRFYDKPGQLEVRKAFMAAHLDWLREHQQAVLAAGSLRAAPEEAPVGGLWIVRAADQAEVEALLQADPFWVQGLRERVEIYSWYRAFDEPVLI